VSASGVRAFSYALLRLIIGILFACHGAQKLFGAFGGPGARGDATMLVAGVVELAAGVLVALGLFTRIAAFLASGEMAVAYFTAHAPRGFWPIENGGELAVVYCFALLMVAAWGGGEFSLDRIRRSGESRDSSRMLAAVARARSVLPQD
jgi:putative oxidoreductase